MLLYVTESLDESERAELSAHLASGCPACAGALAEAQATVAHLPMTLPQQQAPKSARDRLLSRVAVGPKAHVPRRWFLNTALAASIGALLAAAAIWLAMRDKFNMIRAAQLEMVHHA